MNRIGIFGGSFNPVHCGHILVAETALIALGLDHVIWVPTYWPTHKHTDCFSFDHRLKMVDCAIAQHPQFSVSNITAQHKQPSFGILTLQALQSLHPGHQWFWILGLDTFQTLPRWPHLGQLMADCTWLIAPRTDTWETCRRSAIATCQDLLVHDSTLLPKWHLLEMPTVDISSSKIRQSYGLGDPEQTRSIQAWLPPGVHAYILTHRLYCPT